MVMHPSLTETLSSSEVTGEKLLLNPMNNQKNQENASINEAIKEAMATATSAVHPNTPGGDSNDIINPGEIDESA